MKNAEQSAFPHAYPEPYVPGLTKREHFAAMAMQGILQSASIQGLATEHEYARWSVEQADALLAALDKPTT